MKKILVLHGAMYGDAIKGLGDITTRSDLFKENPKNFSLVLFTGGEDVSPSLYKECSPKGLCGYSMFRDQKEIEIYKLALDNGIKMAGICRGIQFLNVMAGGKMFHDVGNHAGTTHQMELISGRKIKVNSYHHQMVRPPESAKIIGWAEKRLSSYYYGNNDELVEYDGPEPETVIYPECLSFGVQYHPEMIPEDCEAYKFFWEMVKNSLSMEWDKFISFYTQEKYDDADAIENVKSINSIA